VTFGRRPVFGTKGLDPASRPDPGEAGRGVALREVVLPREAATGTDPYQLVHCNIRFVNHMLETGHFRADEILPESIWSYQVDTYPAQVNNGGHDQYLQNSGIDAGRWEVTVEATRRGLAAMGAHDFGAVYEEMLRLLWPDGRVGPTLDEAGRRALTPGPRQIATTLDKRFYDLKGTDRLIARNRAFLLGLKSLRLVPAVHWRAELDRLARLNPRGRQRAEEARRARAAREANDPQLVAAREMCRRAGLVFAGWAAVYPSCRLDGVRMPGWFMTTDKTAAVAFFLADEALLFRCEGRTPDLAPDKVRDHIREHGDTVRAMFDFERARDLIASVRLAAPTRH